jgi:hypothetical protein
MIDLHELSLRALIARTYRLKLANFCMRCARHLWALGERISPPDMRG